MTQQNTPLRLIIRSIVDRDDVTGDPLYWSNEYGWADKADATVFASYSPYIPQFGVYEELS